ncbi:hypothetical protein SLE2022_114450 [Rubroshorea leprosula]
MAKCRQEQKGKLGQTGRMSNTITHEDDIDYLRHKKKEVRRLIRKEKIRFVGLQETKMERIDGQVVGAEWGDGECKCIAENAEGKF